MITLEIKNKEKFIIPNNFRRVIKKLYCNNCDKKISFLIATPRMCPYCYTNIKLNSNLFSTLKHRLSFYLDTLV